MQGQLLNADDTNLIKTLPDKFATLEERILALEDEEEIILDDPQNKLGTVDEVVNEENLQQDGTNLQPGEGENRPSDMLS